MSKIESQLKDLLSKAKDFKKYYWVIFTCAFIFLMIMEFFVLKEAYEVVLAVREKPVELKPAMGVRINFKDYQEAIKRIEGAESFRSSARIDKDPFQ